MKLGSDMPASVSISCRRNPARRRRTQQRVEGGLHLAAAGNKHGLDDIAVDAGKGLDQRILRLHLGVDRPRGLGRWDLGGFIVEAHAGLGRLGRRRRRCSVFGGRGGRGRLVVVVKVELARRRRALGGLQQLLGGSFSRCWSPCACLLFLCWSFPPWWLFASGCAVGC